jgi:hypothetical protein
MPLTRHNEEKTKNKTIETEDTKPLARTRRTQKSIYGKTFVILRAHRVFVFNVFFSMF